MLQLAAALDRDMLEGTGTGGKLLGFRNWPNVTTTTLGAGAGAAPTLGDILDAIYRLQADNATPSAIFMHPRTWTTIKKLDDQQDRYLLQPDPTQDAAQRLFGIPVFLSSQISITENPTAVSSYIVIADMSRVAVGKRLDMSVLFDPYSRSSYDQTQIITTTRWGFAVLDETAVEVIAGVKTS